MIKYYLGIWPLDRRSARPNIKLFHMYFQTARKNNMPQALCLGRISASCGWQHNFFSNNDNWLFCNRPLNWGQKIIISVIKSCTVFFIILAIKSMRFLAFKAANITKKILLFTIRYVIIRIFVKLFSSTRHYNETTLINDVVSNSFFQM